MKTVIRSLLCASALCLLLPVPAEAQDRPLSPDMLSKRFSMPSFPSDPRSLDAQRFRIPGKKVSQYATEDWGAWIDSTWGPGQGATTQLQIFNEFWNLIAQQWAGFPNLGLNCSYWDSVANVYRPQIGSGLSRGRFYALMSRMWMALSECHTAITDWKVDTTFGYSSWHYRRGVPLLIIGPVGDVGLGAAVTPLPDTTNLVYRVALGNPLGLEPGDLIVGYEGIPWKRLYPQLLNAGLPVSLWASLRGSTSASATHYSMMGVAFNWGMFDTIDVVKYSSGDTLHLPTALLDTIPPSQPIWPSDQVPVAGVPMPQAPHSAVAVSWGVVEGKNIGYIYVWDWWSTQTQQLFQNAVNDLLHARGVEGLVLDFRMNYGGDYTVGNIGISQLFNFDPTVNLRTASRNSTTDCLSFTLSDFLWASHGFAPGRIYDRPIAVLIGPGCFSAGDLYAWRMHFHPMARFFGKPTNGAFVGESFAQGTLPGGWWYYFPTEQLFSLVPGEGYLMHKGVQPDEEVWLTRDGVAKGEDDVVKRAIEWITTLTYAHDVALDHTFARPGLDSVCVTARLTNPLSHSAALSAIVTDSGAVVRDSLLLYNDGLHGDGQPGDSIWGCRIPAPSDEGYFNVSLRADDLTQTSYRKLLNVVHFTTAGPLALDSVAVTKFVSTYRLRPYLRNNGSSFTVHGAMVTLRSNDPWIKSINSTPVPLPDLAPGAMAGTTSVIGIAVDTATCPGYVNTKAEISVNGWVCWTDTLRVYLPGWWGVEEKGSLPLAFALGQNYPNPFNPSTTIRYELPHASRVSLKVYNTLGQEVAALVNETKAAGLYTVQFDAGGLASGVYFYRIQAGSFLETKKMLVVK